MKVTEKSIDEDIKKIQESMANLQKRSNQLSQELVRTQQATIAWKGRLEYALELKTKFKKGD